MVLLLVGVFFEASCHPGIHPLPLNQEKTWNASKLLEPDLRSFGGGFVRAMSSLLEAWSFT